MTRDEEILAKMAGKYLILTNSSRTYVKDENASVSKSVMAKIDWGILIRFPFLSQKGPSCQTVIRDNR